MDTLAASYHDARAPPCLSCDAAVCGHVGTGRAIAMTLRRLEWITILGPLDGSARAAQASLWQAHCPWTEPVSLPPPSVDSGKVDRTLMREKATEQRNEGRYASV